MQPKIFSRISWSVIVIAALCLGVYVLEKAASAVPFPSAETGSTTEQLGQVASNKLQVTSTENIEGQSSTSPASDLSAPKSAVPPTSSSVQTSNGSVGSNSNAISPSNSGDSNDLQSSIPASYSMIAIKAPLGTITTLIASTSEQQSLGLGQRDSLPADEGMLFPFAVPGQYGFWMKDMRFSLDMVWIAQDKSVVAVSRDVSPETYPLVLYPPSDISYVLELNADSANKFGIATSTKLVF